MLCTLLVFIQYFFFFLLLRCADVLLLLVLFFLAGILLLLIFYFIKHSTAVALLLLHCCRAKYAAPIHLCVCVLLSGILPETPCRNASRDPSIARTLSSQILTEKKETQRRTYTHTHIHSLTLSPRAEFVTIFLSLAFRFIHFVLFLFLCFSHFFSFPLFLFVYWLSVTLVDLNVVIAISIRLSLITYLAPLSFFFFYLFFSCQHACLCLSHFLWLGALVSLEDRLCRLDSRSKKKNWYRFRSFVSSIGIWQVDYWSKRVLMLQKLERWIAHFPRGVSSSKGGEILHRGSP